jgi:hypothetical protein
VAYDPPEVADSRRIVREALDNQESTWQRTEWTPDGDVEEPEGEGGGEDDRTS